VPVLNASLTDCVFEMKRPVTADDINRLFRAAVHGFGTTNAGRNVLNTVVTLTRTDCCLLSWKMVRKCCDNITYLAKELMQ
jgi:glyceraldehyde-3-phosphate dehydrogenase/erythrose-4-phosphate dehydrogenase